MTQQGARHGTRTGGGLYPAGVGHPAAETEGRPGAARSSTRADAGDGEAATGERGGWAAELRVRGSDTGRGTETKGRATLVTSQSADKTLGDVCRLSW